MISINTVPSIVDSVVSLKFKYFLNNLYELLNLNLYSTNSLK